MIPALLYIFFIIALSLAMFFLIALFRACCEPISPVPLHPKGCDKIGMAATVAEGAVRKQVRPVNARTQRKSLFKGDSRERPALPANMGNSLMSGESVAPISPLNDHRNAVSGQPVAWSKGADKRAGDPFNGRQRVAYTRNTEAITNKRLQRVEPSAHFDLAAGSDNCFRRKPQGSTPVRTNCPQAVNTLGRELDSARRSAVSLSLRTLLKLHRTLKRA